MSNPYQSPSFDPKHFQDYSTPFPPPPNTGFGWVQQVRVVAILNCVQGGLECLLGGFAIVGGTFMSIAMQMEQNRGVDQNGPGWIVGAIYGAFGAIVLLAGLLRFYTGWQNFRYRKRVLGIVSFVCGLVSMLACYCAPTGIAMLIYGLIVYLHPAVKAAFEMGEKGLAGDAIINSFLPYPPQQFGQAPPYGPPPTYGQPPNYGQSPFQPPPPPPPG